MESSPAAKRHDQAIADALARPGFAIDGGYLNAPATREAAATLRRHWLGGDFRPAGVGRGASLRVVPEVRNDRVCWLDPATPEPPFRRWLDRMEGLRQTLNRELALGLFEYEAHLTVYPPGASYNRHLDRFSDAAERTVSVILYLNEGWRATDGGALRLYLDQPGTGPWLDTSPEAGTVVAFLSDRFWHEVLPAGRERLSITGWFRRRR